MARSRKQKTKKKERSIVMITAMDILRGVVFAGVFTVFAILAFAFCLKAFSMDNGPIPVINQLIKMVGIYITVHTATKHDQKPGIIKGAACGMVYAGVGFLFFSLIAGDWGMLPILLSDISLGGICGMVYALLLGLLANRQPMKKSRV